MTYRQSLHVGQYGGLEHAYHQHHYQTLKHAQMSEREFFQGVVAQRLYQLMLGCSRIQLPNHRKGQVLFGKYHLVACQ